MNLWGVVNTAGYNVTNNKIFDPFPSGFHYTSHHKHCYVFVHPSYSIYEQYGIETDKYGPYREYLQNIEQLIRYLKDSKELTIFAIENKVFQKRLKMKKNYRPLDSSLIIVTADSHEAAKGLHVITGHAYGTVKKNVETQNGIKRQKIDTVFSFLKYTNIHEARFAGEWAWHEGAACLSTLAENFYRAGFNVKGINGCIYPTVRAPLGIDNEVLEKLYVDPVELLL